MLGAEAAQAADGSRGSAESAAAPYAAQLQAVLGRLRAGDVSQAQASAALVEAIVKARGADLTAAQRQGLTEALSRVLTEDPQLAAHLSTIADIRADE